MICERLENNYGRVLVGRILGYFTVARYGLSENELEDILSLDDDVLNDIYMDCIPTIGRIPSLLWIRVCDELSPYLVERTIDGVLVKSWSHEQMREIAGSRYFGSQDKKRLLHSNVADYFLGVWSNGVKKPIVTISGDFGKKDRLVANQPLQFFDGLPNYRKLHELPYHLLESDRLGTLKVKALCNYEWLAAKMTVTCFSDVIEDFTMAFKKYPDDEQLKTVSETLQLSKYALLLDTTHLSSQLIGRITRANGLEELLKQAHASITPSLVPSLPFLSPPNSQMVHCLNGHSTTITTIDMTQDGKYIATASLDETINIWSTEGGVLQTSVSVEGKRIMKLKYANVDKLLLASFADTIDILNAETLVSQHCVNVRGLDGKAPPFSVGGKSRKIAVTVRPGKLVLLDVVKGGSVMAEVKDSILQRSCEGTRLDARGDIAAYFNPVNKKQVVKLVNLDGKPVIKSVKIPTHERAGTSN
ncbi:NACHT domain- and WD repeat-containing protein 1-like [Glandiceps talaboti]